MMRRSSRSTRRLAASTRRSPAIRAIGRRFSSRRFANWPPDCRPSGRLPIGHILVFAGAAGGVVGTEAVQVEGAVLARHAIAVRPPPRIRWHLLLLQIRPLPAIEAGRLFNQGGEPFALRRIASDIEPEQIERRFEVADVEASDFR